MCPSFKGDCRGNTTCFISINIPTTPSLPSLAGMGIIGGAAIRSFFPKSDSRDLNLLSHFDLDTDFRAFSYNTHHMDRLVSSLSVTSKG